MDVTYSEDRSGLEGVLPANCRSRPGRRYFDTTRSTPVTTTAEHPSDQSESDSSASR